MAIILKTAALLSALSLCFGGDDTLNFSLIVSFGQEGFNSSASVPAVDLALEHIKEQNILGSYVLNYTTLRDSECNRGKSLDVFFREVHRSQPVKIAVIGCGCSVATEPVAEISHQWNISQVSFASAVSSLSDRSRFKNFFRVYPTVDNFALALLSALEHYGWKRIVFLTQNENLFTRLAAGFQALVRGVASKALNICCFNGANITVLNRLFLNTIDPIPEIEDVLEENGNYRVFYLNSYSAVTRKIICEAAKRNLTYPHYVWITFGWYPIRWWTQEVSQNTVNCTEAQLQNFIEKSRFILVRQFPTPDDANSITTAKISALQFDQLYDERSPNRTFVEVTVGRLAYNAVWTLALALNRTMGLIEGGDISETGCEERGLDGALVPLHEFDYANGLMGCVIRWCLEQTDFDGVTGRVKFDGTGTIVIQRIRILQYRKSTEVSGEVDIDRYGYVDKTSGFRFTYEDMESDQTVFPDGIPPDGTPLKIVHTFHPGLVTTYYILATIGICCAIGCLLFNFIFRKKKLIRLTSPKINYFIAVGSMLMYVSVYVGVNSTTDRTLNHVRCILEPWFYIMGYLLAVGSILAKMWRVYHIFHNPTPKKTNLTDCHLIVLVLLVAGVGAILVTIRSATLHDPPSLVRDKEDSEGRTALGIMENYCVWQCYESLTPPFYLDVMIFIYLAVLEIVGIVLAFQTRKVKIPILNDSKFVAALIYISSLILIVLLLITFVVSGYLNTISGVFYGGILILASCFLGLIFVPKIVRLYQDPEGEKIFSASQNGTFQSGTFRAVLTLQRQPGKEDDSVTFKKKIEEQDLLIQEKEKRISELEHELSASKNGVIHRADDEGSSPSLSEQDL